MIALKRDSNLASLHSCFTLTFMITLPEDNLLKHNLILSFI